VPYSILFATILAHQASNNHTKRVKQFAIRRITVSVKAALVVLWACLIAGAAIASESHRLCVLHTHTEMNRLHEEPQLLEEETDVLVVAEVDVTN
jgi:hypothetical protein